MVSLIDWLQWRASRKRVSLAADVLMNEHGEHAFFRAHERAWAAQGEAVGRQTKFWQCVCREVSRRIQRDSILTRCRSGAGGSAGQLGQRLFEL